MKKGRILVVDDEPKVVRLVREILGAADYEVITAYNAEQAIEKTAMEQPDLLLLDIVLNGPTDGYEVCQRIHEFSNLPVIMLTGKVRESDLLRGFEVGADDYITKPFNSKELLARIQAVLKRSRLESQPSGEEELVFDRLRINLVQRRVWVNDLEVRLTETEYNLLHELAIHRDRVLSHEHLLNVVWGEEYRNDVDYLRAYIYNLRKKIENDPAHPTILLRCPGVGYMLAGERTKC